MGSSYLSLLSDDNLNYTIIVDIAQEELTERAFVRAVDELKAEGVPPPHVDPDGRAVRPPGVVPFEGDDLDLPVAVDIARTELTDRPGKGEPAQTSLPSGRSTMRCELIISRS